MSDTRTVLILGASYAGSGAAHYFARHIQPRLPSDEKATYRAIVVDPSSKWFLNQASPRAVASEELMPNQNIFLNTEDGFKQYGNKVDFVQGSAIGWDPEQREVRIQSPSGKVETISYYALILATGTQMSSPLFSLQGGSYQDSQDALNQIRSQLPMAKSIVITGGGPTGVETAGELGEMLNGRAGWFSSRLRNPNVQITLYTNSSQLLPVLRPALGRQAELYLNKLGVEVHYNTKVVSATPSIGGKTTVALHNSEEVVADIYIPTTGLTPMTSFVPKHLLDERGYIKTNEQTLRVDEAGPRVYAVGDVASYSRNNILDILESVPVLETNLKRDLLAAHHDPNSKPSGPDRKWKPFPSETQLVPVGRSKGVGAAYGWRLPSFFVWLFKGRNYMVTAKGSQDRLMGKDWAKESAWKPTA